MSVEQLDIFAEQARAEADAWPTPWRDDTLPIDHRVDVDHPLDVPDLPGLDRYAASCATCGLPPRAHWHHWRADETVDPDVHVLANETRDTRWNDDEGSWAGGDLWHRVVCSCGWSGRGWRSERVAVYEALNHVAPGWVTLPAYDGPRHPDTKKGRERREAALLYLYGPDPAVILSTFAGTMWTKDGERVEHACCRGVVPGRPVEVCVHPSHHLRLLGRTLSPR